MTELASIDDLRLSGDAAPSRVTVVIPRLDVGGTERHLLRVLPELRRRGIELSLYVLDRGGKLERDMAARGIPILGSQMWGPKFLRALVSMVGLSRHLRQSRPDLVHCFLPKAYLLGSLAALLTGFDRLIMSRRSLANYQARHLLLTKLEFYFHRRTKVLLGNSTAVVRELVAEAAKPDKIGLIHNGIVMQSSVSANGRAAMRKLLWIDEKAVVIACIANLAGYKGHATLLDALGLVRDRLPQPWRLLLIGRDDGIGNALAERAGRLGIAVNIAWAGERSDVEALLEGVDIAVLPSHEEGFSNALLEVMGKGIATVATAVGGNVDAMVDGESGLLVPPAAPRELGDAILSLCWDGERRRRIAEAGRRRIESLFSLTRCVERYERLYRKFDDIGDGPVHRILDGAEASREPAPR